MTHRRLNHLELDSIIVQQLYREVEEISYYYKIKFKKIIILITDQKTYWGQYDGLAKTISLSRNLIWNYPWSVVIGILKHELAHQYVDENRNGRGDVQAHGLEFRQACQLLRVPSVFCQARIDLADVDPEKYFEEGLDESENPLFLKIQKLLSLAQSSNEHEANLAAQKVRQIYLKYQLDLNQNYKEIQYHHGYIYLNKKKISLFEKKLIHILTQYYFVQVIVVRHFSVQRQRQEFVLEVIGEKANVKMAEYIFEFLKRFCYQQADLHKEQLTTLRKKESFLYGILDGFDHQLKKNDHDQSVVSTAEYTVDRLKTIEDQGRHLQIVLAQQNQKLNQYFREHFPYLRQTSRSQSRLDQEQLSHGQHKGQKLRISKPIETKSHSIELIERLKK